MGAEVGGEGCERELNPILVIHNQPCYRYTILTINSGSAPGRIRTSNLAPSESGALSVELRGQKCPEQGSNLRPTGFNRLLYQLELSGHCESLLNVVQPLAAFHR